MGEAPRRLPTPVSRVALRLPPSHRPNPPSRRRLKRPARHLPLLLPTAVAYTKYRSVPGYHTWLAKLTSVLMGIAVPLLLIFDFAWPFRVAAFSLLLSAIDEIAITWLLPECRHDVPSVLHALRLRSRSDSSACQLSPPHCEKL